MINVCSLECDLTKHYPWSLLLFRVDGSQMVLQNPKINNYFCLKRFCLRILLNKKFNEIVVLDLWLVPLHPHDGCKQIHRHGEIFEILDFYKAPPSHSNGFYILGNSFSFHSYFFFIVSQTQIIRTCADHRRLFVFAFRDSFRDFFSLFNNRIVPTQEKHQLMDILKTSGSESIRDS